MSDVYTCDPFKYDKNEDDTFVWDSNGLFQFNQSSWVQIQL